MIVSELITELQRYNPDLPVCVGAEDGFGDLQEVAFTFSNRDLHAKAVLLTDESPRPDCPEPLCDLVEGHLHRDHTQVEGLYREVRQ
jgi:hypothetical protein